jgi:DNA-binding response OmpR family regulator
MAKRRVLLVDDDGALREALVEQFSESGEFSALGVDSIRAAEAAIAQDRFDAFLLDVGLPDGDGRELCRKLRAAGVRAPIIMLTGAGGDTDTIKGLDAGANDYIAKPFRLPVLLARLHAQLRQFELSDEAQLVIGPFSFKPAAKMLVDEARKKKVRLTEKETSILKYLYRMGSRAVPRETLLHEIWGYAPGVTTHTVETHIYRLRQKIERDPTHAELLVTEAGGYRLALPPANGEAKS